MKTNILAIGRNKEIMEVVLRLINQNKDWYGVAAITDEEAIEAFQQQQFNIVLLCSGIEEESEKMLRNYFASHNRETIIIQHYGGGSGLLSNEIFEALSCSESRIAV